MTYVVLSMVVIIDYSIIGASNQSKLYIADP